MRISSAHAKRATLECDARGSVGVRRHAEALLHPRVGFRDHARVYTHARGEGESASAVENAQVHCRNVAGQEPCDGPLEAKGNSERARDEIAGSAGQYAHRHARVRERPYYFYGRAVATQGEHGAIVARESRGDLCAVPWALGEHHIASHTRRAECALGRGEEARRASGRGVRNEEDRSPQKLHSRNRSKPSCGGRFVMSLDRRLQSSACDDGSTLACNEKP